eukprot:1125203_1
MAASSNRNESYIIEDILMTLATWYSSFLYQILMDSYDSITSCTVTIHSTTTTMADHNHQDATHDDHPLYHAIHTNNGLVSNTIKPQTNHNSTHFDIYATNASIQ